MVPDKRRTAFFGWYNLAGSFAAAAGALSGGWLAKFFQEYGSSALESCQYSMAGYAGCGVVLFLLFSVLSKDAEVSPAVAPGIGGPAQSLIGLHQSKKIVFRLSPLFALDAFAGGFVVQSMIAWWFHARYGIDEGNARQSMPWKTMPSYSSSRMANV